MSLKNITPTAVWDRFMNMSKRSIEFAESVYNSNPNVPAAKGKWKRFFRVGAFALEFIKKVVIKKKMTPEEFMKYKSVSPYQLYKIYFNKISEETIALVDDEFSILEFKDDDSKLVNIVMSDDCYTCT